MPENAKASNVLERLHSIDWWIDNCLSDLYFLARNVLVTIERPTPGFADLYYPMHSRVCNYITEYAVPKQKVLLLLPRFWIKSYIVTVGWTIQRLLRNLVTGERDFIVITSSTLDDAREFLEKIKYNLQYNERLRGFFGKWIPKNIELEAETWTKDEIMIGGNKIQLGSVEKNLVSRHFNIIIYDDPVTWANSRTPESLQMTIDWWTLARSLLHPQLGMEILIGTRWNFDDLYGHVIKRFLKPPQDFHLRKPIVFVHKNRYHLMQADCWANPAKEEGSTFPVLFPEEELKSLQVEMGEDFNYQYRNDPIAKGKAVFNPKYIQNWKILPKVRYSAILLDVAGTDKRTSDFTGIVAVDFGSDKHVYVREAFRKKMSDIELLETIVYLACKYGTHKICIESTKYSTITELMELYLPQMFKRRMIAPGHLEYAKTIPYLFHELKHHGRPKPIRIENTAGYIQNGTILFPDTGAGNLLEEIRHYGSMTTDDTLDAFAYLLDIMFFPQPNDPEKPPFLPPEQSKTSEERMEEEWEQLREDVLLSGKIANPDLDDLYGD